MDSILEMYLYETNSLLEQLDSIALSAEQSGTFSHGDVDEIFRIMHTIKGASAMMEFNGLMNMAHRLEDMFFIVRDHSMDSLSDATRVELFDVVFQAVDFIRNEVTKLESGVPLSEDIGIFDEKINSLIPKIKSDISGTPAPPDAAAAAETETQLSADGGQFPHSLLVFFDEGIGMENLRAFVLANAVRDFCAEEDFICTPRDVETSPGTSDYIIEHGFLLEFRHSVDRDNAIMAVTSSGSVQNYQIADAETQAAEVPEAAATQPDAAPFEPELPQTQAEDSPAPAPKAEAPALSQGVKESLISVNLSKLDQLMAVVGEIVITESMVTASPDLVDLKLDTFTKSARQLRKLTDELQDVSMSLRMVPVSGTFQKMNRVVRDMGKKLGKQVKLTIQGEDTEVDKTIVDNIGDPIMHIVRNSMDHGIEEHESDRIAAGKNPVGEIVLSARHTGSEVIIEIKDDGKGVNYDAIYNKALRQGLASPDTEYSNREILSFLLMPGFSTNSEVTEFSGRGVGMDVVKRNVEDIGGSVSITSEPGVGMTTTLKIPLTMAIMAGMEVSVGSSIFTIPINNIRQSFKVSGDDIVYDSTRGEMIQCMDHYYPIIRLKNLYSLSDGADEIQDGILMWVESGDISYCLLVDELIGEHQVVVKPLPQYVNAFNIKQYGVNGCTILGDGNISIILDVSNIYTALA